jgi:hypothetical protein
LDGDIQVAISIKVVPIKSARNPKIHVLRIVFLIIGIFPSIFIKLKVKKVTRKSIVKFAGKIIIQVIGNMNNNHTGQIML